MPQHGDDAVPPDNIRPLAGSDRSDVLRKRTSCEAENCHGRGQHDLVQRTDQPYSGFWYVYSKSQWLAPCMIVWVRLNFRFGS